LHTHHVLGM